MNRTDAMTHEQGSAPEQLSAGASLDEVSRAFPGSRVLDGALVLEPEVIYADNGEAEVRYPGLTPEQAARRYADTGDWGVQDITEWVDIYTYRKGFDAAGEPEVVEREAHTIALHPEEPECDSDEGHDWRNPHEVLGGLEENPGVWGHGGGAIIKTVCANCGAYRVLDTWAHRPDTGEEGLESVSYEEADDASLAWVEQIE